eukprot:scaffold61357_cov75-Phaeocystis_antarctica.AAC.6
MPLRREKRARRENSARERCMAHGRHSSVLRLHALDRYDAVFKGCGPHLLEHNALAVRRATERVALELSAQVSLLIALLRPPLLATHGAQLARRVNSTRLTCER